MANNDTTEFTIASSLKYGYDNKYTQWCKDVVSMLEIVMPLARKLVDVPLHLKIHLKPHRRANAYYHHFSRTVVIDPRRCNTTSTLVSALLHELVHAEQFKQGRLELGVRTMKWMGKPVVQETRNYAKYRAQPWEVEAFGREKELCDKIADMLKEKLDASR